MELVILCPSGFFYVLQEEEESGCHTTGWRGSSDNEQEEEECIHRTSQEKHFCPPEENSAWPAVISLNNDRLSGLGSAACVFNA